MLQLIYMKIGMIHQPHFLPWPGYIARCRAADIVILLDDVPFKKNYFQNRTKYINREGQSFWLTLPIDHGTWRQPISKVKISNKLKLDNMLSTLNQMYPASEELRQIQAVLEFNLCKSNPSLCDTNVMLLKKVLDILSSNNRAKPTVHMSSETRRYDNRSERLLALSKNYKIDHLLMGEDSIKAHDIKLLQNNGIKILLHGCTGNTKRYPSGVSIIDLLFRYGTDQTITWLDTDWGVIKTYQSSVAIH